ncbi:MAG: alpha/beta hydrolase [Candidatus Aminicenantia bacterium]
MKEKKTIVFIHGLESSSLGTKARIIRSYFPEAIIPDFRGSLKERLKNLNAILTKKSNLIILGSSFGGLMAAIFTCQNPKRVNKLILFAPALNLEEFKPFLKCRLSVPTIIYHALQDEVVPFKEVKNTAEKVFKNLDFCQVDDDHRLQATVNLINWRGLILGEIK